MYWNESADTKTYTAPPDVVDLLFKIDCPCLPADNAVALADAVVAVLPWLADEPLAAIHPIHGASSGNGWQRSDELLQLSRRSRFILRLPQERISDAEALCGQTLDIVGFPLQIGSAHTRSLSTQTTVFARQVRANADDSEDEFLEKSAAELRRMGITLRKMLCGRAATMNTPSGSLFVRSLMLAELEPEHSILLQRHGLGPDRLLGCGLFLPHKGIAPVYKSEED